MNTARLSNLIHTSDKQHSLSSNHLSYQTLVALILQSSSLHKILHYNYKNKVQIFYNREYLDYIRIIRNIFIYSCIISLLLEDTKSPLLIVLLFFLNINKPFVLTQKHMFST